ncbi:uncharacterized protein LOC123027249 isoform X1 [Varanus komodoensis]|uniref:uncharacterized protein LOC123027249 isoform X1 n=1 Tax=Varanus komodoensis TaxID=61221 RepID=UPI001CF7881B|nr:uncharacterized protein LOC123027249 isoform X1 [Varanus komodoensis]
MVQGRGSPWVRRRCRTAPPSIHSGCFFLKCLRCPGNMAWMMLCDAHGLPGALCRAARRHVQSRHRSGGAHGSSLARNATAVHKLHDGWKDVAGKPSQESSLGFSELAGRLRLDRLAYSLEHSSKSRGGDMQVQTWHLCLTLEPHEWAMALLYPLWCLRHQKDNATVCFHCKQQLDLPSPFNGRKENPALQLEGAVLGTFKWNTHSGWGLLDAVGFFFVWTFTGLYPIVYASIKTYVFMAPHDSLLFS